MLRLEEAVQILQEEVRVIEETEEVELLKASGRILAEEKRALEDQPPFPRSPLDGYALRGAQTRGAEKDSPRIFRVVGTVYAGEVFSGYVGENEAVRIMTGAPIPEGADTVIRQEDSNYGKETVEIYRESKPFENYCYQGEDYRKGTVLLKEGTVLDGFSTALAASLGAKCVKVYRKPRIAVISTGDELVQPGQPLSAGKIYDSNRHLISGRLADLGVDAYVSLHGEDEAERMADMLSALAGEADLIITTGGVSVGEKDILHRAVELASARKLFWKVEIKPGAPTLAAVLDKTLLVCLSGNPFAAAANFELLVRPVIAKLTGDKRWLLEKRQARMENDYIKPKGTRRFLRGYMEGETVWAATGNHASGALSAMLGCNCLIEISPEQAGAKRGEWVWVHRL